eukprot:m.235072 g.235072  ORF g.235072 m.235072 type:complete len:51 (+) comp15258_c5_seq2:1716-1868(+)
MQDSVTEFVLFMRYATTSPLSHVAASVGVACLCLLLLELVNLLHNGYQLS